LTESLDAFNELRSIRARVEGIEHRQEVLVRAHADGILQTIWQYIDRDPDLGEIYLLIDGKRTQQDIVAALKGKAGASQPTVSRKLSTLMRDLGLIEFADHTDAGKTYKKSPLDGILQLSPKIERRLRSGPILKGAR
jgi:hypothetical protein